MKNDAKAPEPVAQEFRPFFEGLARGRLSFPQCTACSKFHWYPLHNCPHCGSQAIQWTEIEGQASLYSWTIVHHGFAAEPARPLPYTVGLVEFADAPGVRLITNIENVRAAELSENMPLAPVIRQGPPPTVIFVPLSRPSGAGAS